MAPPKKVSLVVWRDARTDPPRLGTDSAVLAQYKGGDVVATFSEFVAEHPAHFKAWAELPVVSDLTDDDVRKVAFFAGPDSRAFEEYALSSDVGSYHAFNNAVRAALGGEKEET